MSDRRYDIPSGYDAGQGGTRTPVSPAAPPVPQHDSPPTYSQQESYPARQVSPVCPQTTTTPGQDNYGLASAGGGITGIAAGVANSAPRDSGAQALRDVDSLYNPSVMSPSPDPYRNQYGTSQHDPDGMDTPYELSPIYQQHPSQSSLAPLTANQGMNPSRSPDRTSRHGAPVIGATVGAGAGAGAAGLDGYLPRGSYYHGDGYDHLDLDNIADDGDDGLDEQPRSRNGPLGSTAAAGAGAGAGAGMFNSLGSRDANNGAYGPVGNDAEKSAWLAKQSTGNKRLKWIIGITVTLVLLGALAGGVAGGILANKGSSNGSGAGNGNPGSSKGSHSGGLYDINSDEVQAVMGDTRLHKVFPAMDYTPNYAQYPQCLSPGGGPVQNNVTIDVAIMSQLTPAIRLYGTDCNQTELVMEAINLLELNGTMKVWLGIYLDGNSTTNNRQTKQAYEILDKYPHESFAGVILGNEVLFSQYMTETELAAHLGSMRSNFTAKNINLPVSTADLGDKWTADLAQASDIVMANIHPFFAGTSANASAGWAYTFWHSEDVPLTTQQTAKIGDITYPTQIISETGWPSEGGNDCGDATSDTYGCTSTTDGAVASIENLNTYLEDWVCDALTNGTTFFWFEAFDEPWKHKFDTAHDKWEPYWGLFDVNRNLKDGVKIPDCGTTTVDKPY